MDCSPPGSSLHRILQARIREWVAILFFRGSSQPKGWPWVTCIAGRLFYHLSHHGFAHIRLPRDSVSSDIMIGLGLGTWPKWDHSKSSLKKKSSLRLFCQWDLGKCSPASEETKLVGGKLELPVIIILSSREDLFNRKGVLITSFELLDQDVPETNTAYWPFLPYHLFFLPRLLPFPHTTSWPPWGYPWRFKHFCIN